MLSFNLVGGCRAADPLSLIIPKPTVLATTPDDARIVGIVCLTVVTLAFFALLWGLGWKAIDCWNQRKMERIKRENEVNDRAWKLMTDLKEKYMVFLREMTNIPDKDDKIAVINKMKSTTDAERKRVADWFEAFIMSAETNAGFTVTSNPPTTATNELLQEF